VRARVPRLACYCHTQPDCARHVVCVESAAHGVTVPVQFDELDCQ
jgi:hypothetical protein